MQADMRVLFLAPVQPWCRENGASLITADLLEGLATVPDVDLFAVFLRDPPPGFKPSRKPRIAEATLSIKALPRWFSIVSGMLRGRSPLRERFANRKVAMQILQVMRDSEFVPTVVHVEHLPLVDMAICIAEEFNCPVVYRAHNVESQLWSRRLSLPGPLQQWVVRHIEKEEAAAIDACAHTLCISDIDLEWTRAHAPAARASVFPCSLLVERYDAVRDATSPADRQMCFVGGLEWGPNEVGLRWFVDEVLPKVVAQVPDAKLAVLARGASERSWLTSNPAVKLLPGTSDARTVFAQSSVSIAPLLQGGGVRIKIPESLALGCPVVGTRIGAEGHYLSGLSRTDDPTEFAAACVTHLRNPLDAAMRASLRAGVEDNYGAVNLAHTLVRHWADASTTRVVAAY